MENQILCISSTSPSKELAERLAETLVAEHLAACVQIGSPVDSTYIWKGVMCRSREYAVFIKATESVLDRLRVRFMELHEYECPEWIVASASASSDYAKFVDGACGA